MTDLPRHAQVQPTMAAMYGDPNGTGMPEMNIPKASQACLTCRKQKRKCSKTIPSCALCERMNRHCDYSDSAPPPTHEDFSALRIRIMELESRLNGGNGVMSPPTTFATPSSALSAAEQLGQPTPAYNPPQQQQDFPSQPILNRFPAIAFLDSDSFKHGGSVRLVSTFMHPTNILLVFQYQRWHWIFLS